MSGQKIGLTAGRSLSAARGVHAATFHSSGQNDSNQGDSRTPELKDKRDSKSTGKDSCDSKPVADSKSANAKCASAGGGGGGGGGDPGDVTTPTVVDKPWYRRRGFVGAAVGTAVGATAAVVAAPLVIGAIGFGAGGIAAGSIANGGAVAAGSLVATLQSIVFILPGWFGVGAAVAAAGAVAGASMGAAADTAPENGTGTTTTPQDGAEGVGEVENSDDEENGGVEIADDMARLKVNGESQIITTNLLSIIISESDGSVRRFEVNSSEPLQGMFDEYFEQTGLSPDSVMFEFNGLRLVGSEWPQELEIEDDYIIKALRFSDGKIKVQRISTIKHLF